MKNIKALFAIYILFIAIVITGCEYTAHCGANCTFLDITPPYPPIYDREQIDSTSFALIIDPGHGGPDTGTHFEKQSIEICEDEITQDLVQRLSKLAKSYNSNYDRPLLRVVPTIKHQQKDDQLNTLQCDDSTKERYNYPNGMKKMHPATEGGLDQRAQVISYWQETLRSNGFDKNRIALLSIHVNYTNPSRQGVFMLYPGFIYDKLRIKKRDSNLQWKSMIFGTYLMHGIQLSGVQLHTYEAGTPAYLFRGYYTYLNSSKGVYDIGRLAIFRDTPKMPKLLVECANIRHPDDRKRIITEEYRQNIAMGLLNGVLSYANLPDRQ